MDEERLYKLEDGTEMVLMSRINYNDKRYLLLINNANNEVKIGYEEDNNLVYIEETNPLFNELIVQFSEKNELNENLT